ncbi:MAG: hypothetical protein PHU79_06935, partial [Oscillospiraceae bacterium]|nr:hypothetical protein [Oscillospiraceae bacterium]
APGNGTNGQQGGTSSSSSQSGQMPNGQAPGNGTNGQQGGTSGGESFTDSGLETYLKKNYKQGSFLLTACRSDTIAQLIIDTGLPCYAYGGFLGSDNSLTLTKLKSLVAEGKITYFLVSDEGGGTSNSEITSYVTKNAKKIDSSAYSSSSSTSGKSSGTLYLFSK